MARTHRSIQRRLAVHQRASSDVERSARARDFLGRRSGVWSVEGNFLPVANSPRTRWVGWRPRLKNESRPVCPAVGVTPNEATVIRPISSSQRETVPRRLGSRGTRAHLVTVEIASAPRSNALRSTTSRGRDRSRPRPGRRVNHFRCAASIPTLIFPSSTSPVRLRSPALRKGRDSSRLFF